MQLQKTKRTPTLRKPRAPCRDHQQRSESQEHLAVSIPNALENQAHLAGPHQLYEREAFQPQKTLRQRTHQARSASRKTPSLNYGLTQALSASPQISSPNYFCRKAAAAEEIIVLRSDVSGSHFKMSFAFVQLDTTAEVSPWRLGSISCLMGLPVRAPT